MFPLVLLVMSAYSKYIITTRTEDTAFVTEDTVIIGNMRYDFVDEFISGVPGLEEDIEMSIDGYQLQRDPIWNLDRIDQRSNDLNSMYFYQNLAGTGVYNYVLDTGIDTKHPDFKGRAVWGLNVADNEPEDGCMNPHGTHVAGTIGSKTYGVAKNTSLVSVKVLDCSGKGSTSNILRALEWVTKQDTKKKIVNMSLGGGKSNALNSAVEQLTKLGIVVVAAAGNENSNACDGSPSSSEYSITVGATNKQTQVAYFSNWGSCVDIYAPGTGILSTMPGDKTGFMDGTSMAAPHVSGVISLILDASSEVNPEKIKNFLKFVSTKNKIGGDLKNSPNYLLFSLSSPSLL